YTAEELKDAGYTAEELKYAGFKNIEKIHYQNDGKTIQATYDYSLGTQNRFKTIYNQDRTIKETKSF
ncbi:hypothetical protein KEC49_02655, partial ['Elaeagnus angustifolia' witches'-broom phytoplasma]|nr:hypothetical protein ['Elaeagnus angustifolia' witches'-broom phytoplasma]MCX2955934.1 hypothetical protein [Candidatus Phytoplasma australiense]